MSQYVLGSFIIGQISHPNIITEEQMIEIFIHFLPVQPKDMALI